LQRARDWGAEDRKADNRKKRRDEVASRYEDIADRLPKANDQGYDQVAAGVGSESS
jgi:hypothetical protein